MNTWRGGEKIYFEQVISDGLTDHKSTWQHFSRTLTISQDVIQITGIEIKIAPVCHHICKSTTVHQSSELIIFNPLYSIQFSEWQSIEKSLQSVIKYPMHSSQFLKSKNTNSIHIWIYQNKLFCDNIFQSLICQHQWFSFFSSFFFPFYDSIKQDMWWFSFYLLIFNLGIQFTIDSSLCGVCPCISRFVLCNTFCWILVFWCTVYTGACP